MNYQGGRIIIFLQTKQLLSYMMCSSVDSLKEKAKWTGLDGDSRATLLTRLQSNLCKDKESS